MYDLIIIGSGPAGLSAAVYAKRAGYSPLMKWIIIWGCRGLMDMIWG